MLIGYKNDRNLLYAISIVNLRYYGTFKVRKFESLLCTIYTFLHKTTTCIGLQAAKILSVNVWYTYFFNFGCGSFTMLFPEASASSDKKKVEIIFAALYFYLYELRKCISDF